MLNNTKTLIAVFICFLGILGCNAASYSGKCGTNVSWKLDETGNLVISGNGDMNDYSRETPWLPELVRTIDIEPGVRYIGKNAFRGTKVSTVALPSGLEQIGTGAFKNCKMLASVTLPYGLNIIDKGAFQGCKALPKIIIPASVKVIGEKAFDNCEVLVEVSVPSRVNVLGKDAFKGCLRLKTIEELPDFVRPETAALYGLNPMVVAQYTENKNSERQSEQSVNTAAVSSLNASDNKVVNANKNITAIHYGESDVDAPMKVRAQNNSNTFAFIISNENYAHLSDVPFAKNDGASFARYCTDVLGLPRENVNVYDNATWGAMKGAIGYLKDVDEAYKGDINVLVYYAGHGGPSDDTQETFLIPVDAVKVGKDYCYALNDLYKELSELKANSVKIFLDACFSGASRDNAMVEKARKVAVVPKKANVAGNLVVISAASDDQTAWQYEAQGHGLFTYFLLKKLRETGGDVSLGELVEYIDTNVTRTSVVVNRKKQNPSVTASKAIGDRWRSWTVK